MAKTPISSNMMSATTLAQDLRLISLHINKVTESKDKKIDNILSKPSKVFSGLGKLKDGQIKLSIDHNQPPKEQSQRRIPYHVRDKVENALEELENNEIIERVPENQPTPWVSPTVVVAKKDGRLDLSQAYHQLELEEASRYITTFSTRVSLFRYKRLNYGANAVAEIFQFILQQQLQGLSGVKNTADDVILYRQTREEQDMNLDKCLQRLFDRGLRLNQAKFLK